MRNVLLLSAAIFLVTLTPAGANDLLAEINRARTAPAAYARTVETHARQFRSQRSVAEAVAFLNRTKPLPPLEFSTGLALAAQSHVSTQGPDGGRGHGAMARRLARFGNYEGSAGENIAYGQRGATATVVAWIVDEGVPGRGHRRNIFRRDFTVAGVATGSHTRFGSMSVADFAGGFSRDRKVVASRELASFSRLPAL